MRAIAVLLAFTILFSSASAISASDYNVSFTIAYGKAVADYSVGIASGGNALFISAPPDAYAVSASVDGEKTAAVPRQGSSGDYGIEVPVGSGSENVRVGFLTRSLVERSSKSFFLAELKPGIDAESLNLTITLPEGAVLDRPLGSADASVFPKPDAVSTNGQALSFHWDFGSVSAQDSFSIMVVYREPMNAGLIIYAALGLLALGAVALACAYAKKARPKPAEAKKPKEKTPEAKTAEEKTGGRMPGTEHLLEDERRIIGLLGHAKGSTLKQSEIMRHVDFSKAKLSRLLRNLEQRGFVESRPYGNTNIIKLKK